MPVRSLLSLLLFALAASAVHADTVIVDDDFESYANDSALYGVWEPRDGSGNIAPGTLDNPRPIDDGILTNDTLDPGIFPGIEGNAVDYLALGQSTMQHTGLTPTAPINPSETQSVHVQGDIFVGNAGNYRNSIGLRNRTSVDNIFEMGTYNSNQQTTDPTDLDDSVGVVPATAYAYRIVLFGGIGGDLVREPNWQFFQFDLALDVDDHDAGTEEPTPDGQVDIIDIGAGWHTYSATFTPDTITIEMDLYRDGLDNGASITAGSDVAGVDASITYDVSTGTQGFDSLRIGGPSGLSSAGGSAGFDNISLTLVDVEIGGDTDTDNDGDVDGADFLHLQRENPTLIDQWELDYAGNGPLLGTNSVPEPLSSTMALLASVCFITFRPIRRN